MAEKLRRIKNENDSLANRVYKKRLWLAVIVFLCLIIAIPTLIFFSRKNISVSSGQSVSEIKDKNLAAAICQNQTCFWLNKEGMAYSQSGRMGGNLVLNIEDKTSREIKLGEKILDPNSIAKLVFIKDKILADFNVGLNDISMGDADLSDFSFLTSEGWQLRFNLNENADKTLEILKQSLAEIKKTAPSGVEGLEYLDLRIPNKVYYKFR